MKFGFETVVVCSVGRTAELTMLVLGIAWDCSLVIMVLQLLEQMDDGSEYRYLWSVNQIDSGDVHIHSTQQVQEPLVVVW